MHSASTTSLTVVPKAFLIALTSASGTAVNANDRLAVTGWLNDVRGPRNGVAGLPKWCEWRRPRTPRTDDTVRLRGRVARSGV